MVSHDKYYIYASYDGAWYRLDEGIGAVNMDLVGRYRSAYPEAVVSVTNRLMVDCGRREDDLERRFTG